jgi:hypothetical protein
MHVPDLHNEVVPRGWAADIAKPAIYEITSWSWLEDLERRIRAMVAAAEAVFAPGQAVYELRCACRLIEIRRGQLLGPAPGQGARTDLRPRPPMGEVPDVSRQTVDRWRVLADHAELVEDHLWSTDKPDLVTQTRCLELIGGERDRADEVTEAIGRAARLLWAMVPLAEKVEETGPAIKGLARVDDAVEALQAALASPGGPHHDRERVR